jgi:RNA exonuclease 1
MIDYESGIVVYDKLVKPPKPVIDYMTRYFFLKRIVETMILNFAVSDGQGSQKLYSHQLPQRSPKSKHR